MLRKCSDGAAKVHPSGTVSGRPPINLIIYVKSAALLPPAGVLRVCCDLSQITTSGVSPTALCDGLS